MITPDSKSLAEVHSSVATSQVSVWKRMFAFAGPAYLVSVGYMDPGNWATDLEGGARFGYQLLWVLVMSNAMAVLLQTLSARLGIVSGLDLAQACRQQYPRVVSASLYVLCEIAIAACDLAEVIGAAIGLNLLFGLPLFLGVVLTAADTLLVLWLQSFGIRTLEAFVLSLITIIAVCFGIEILFAKPVAAEIFTGLAPHLNHGSLYVAIGILGATVMPHNLYLHSALVQTRQIDDSGASKRQACWYNFVDSLVALNGAMFVNCAILILAAAVFYKRGLVVTEIQQAHLLLAPLLGTKMAGVLFAIALLASGQSSTLTGTMAGQIVMEGFLNFRMRPWLRRLITRSLAITPALITIYVAGDQGTYKLLIFSQVILSMQLPFAVIPLINFTNDRKRMGTFANAAWVRILTWTTALVILVLNVRLLVMGISDWMDAAGSHRGLIWLALGPVSLGLALLLAWITLEPVLPILRPRVKLALEPEALGGLALPAYKRILLTLDHTDLDRQALAHAALLARSHGAKLYLFHVEEGVISQLYGAMSKTAEVKVGQKYLEDVAARLRAEGIDVEIAIRYDPYPRREIVKFAREIHPDLLVMGAHGHRRLKDLIFGDTINPLRHELRIPILVVRQE